MSHSSSTSAAARHGPGKHEYGDSSDGNNSSHWGTYYGSTACPHLAFKTSVNSPKRGSSLAAFRVGYPVFLTLHSSEIQTQGCLTLGNEETLYLPSPGVPDNPNFPAVCTAQGYRERQMTHAMRKRFASGEACSSRPFIQPHVVGFLWARHCCVL